MRDDMAKVLVERPRLRGHIAPGPGTGYRKRLQKTLDAGESPPRCEGMKRPYGWHTKSFNEHLGPLRRFLDANVGRPWDRVHSEICRHVDRGNVVQKHILTHLYDYVAVHVALVEGEPRRVDGNWHHGESLRESHYRHQWYVCPRTGLLCRSRYVPWKRPEVSLPRRVRVDATRLCLEFPGGWELITVAPLPQPPATAAPYDIVRQQQVSARQEGEARRLYGAAVYAVARRPLSRKELRSLPVPIDWLR